VDYSSAKLPPLACWADLIQPEALLMPTGWQDEWDLAQLAWAYPLARRDELQTRNGSGKPLVLVPEDAPYLLPLHDFIDAVLEFGVPRLPADELPSRLPSAPDSVLRLLGWSGK
jgi:hypothetical protein